MRSIERFLLRFLAVFLLPFVSGWAGAAAVPSSPLPNSILPVEAVAPSGSAAPHRAYVSRATLTATEEAAPIEFEIALKMRNFPELQSRIDHGELISSAEMLARYAPLPADYQKMIDWATAQGLTVTHRDSHHMALFVSGSVRTVGRAVQVNFARVKNGDGEFTSAITTPSVPSALAPLLRGINGLQPHLRAHKHFQPATRAPAASGAEGSGYTPGNLATAYSATGLYSAGITGAGQTIAVVIDTFPSKTDLQDFWSGTGVPQSLNNITFIKVGSGTLAAPSGEETLDTEWSSGMAPGAKVRVYATITLDDDNLDAGYLQVYQDVLNHPEYGIHEMTMSFGEGETYDTYDGVLTDDQYYAELAAAGVTCFASSGDNGATPGANDDESGSPQAETPASDPNVTGVGGTTLKENVSGAETSETVWNNSSGASGGGTSIYFTRPVWQMGTGVGSGTLRKVPDVASAGDPDYGAIYYFGGQKMVEGGTSWSSPTWAGLCALINHYRANAGLPAIGNLNAHIYSLIGTSSFRDITSGNNSTSGSNGYSAQTGYDEATGVGVPLTMALAKALTGSQTVPLAETVTPGQTTVFTVATSTSPTAYQWQLLPFGNSTWMNVSDGSGFNGSTTSALSVLSPTMAMSGNQYRCLLTVSGASVATAPSSVLVVDTPLTIATLAGAAGVSGTANGMGTAAHFTYPSGVAVDATGNVYVADFGNNQIREISPAGVVTTPFGSTSGASGSVDAVGNNARFNGPNGIAIDSAGNLFVADSTNNSIRKIVPFTGSSGGSVTTFVGASANLNNPLGVAIDLSDNSLYIADTGNDTIRKVTSTGVVTLLAGNSGNSGWTDAQGSYAQFNEPTGVAVDSSHDVYVTDSTNVVIRKVTQAGVTTTVYGQGEVAGHLDGIGTNTLFDTPLGLAIDSADNLYVTDSQVTYDSNDTTSGNNLVRRITPAGIVSTIAGNPGFTGTTNGTGTAALFFSLQAVAVGNSGTVYLADTYNQLVRQSTSPSPVSIAATTATADVYGPVPGQFTVSRIGSTAGSLVVMYTVSGTGVAGADYSPLPGTVTIPSGSSTATIAVNPLFNANATSSPTVVLTLTASAAYTLGGATSDTVTIVEPQYYQRFQLTEFGSNAYVASISGASADPNHNGVPNLLEYAFNANPLATGTDPSPTLSTVEDGGNEYLAITYTQLNNGDPNLSYTVQVTSDLRQINDQWHSGSSYTTVVSQQVNGATTEVTVRDNTPLSGVTQRFIRVQVTGN